MRGLIYKRDHFRRLCPDLLHVVLFLNNSTKYIIIPDKQKEVILQDKAVIALWLT